MRFSQGKNTRLFFLLNIPEIYSGRRNRADFTESSNNEPGLKVVLRTAAISLLLSVCFFIPSDKLSAQVTCIASGNWSNPLCWSPAIPQNGDNVIINPACTLHVDVSTSILNDMTVNGTMIIDNAASVSLNMSGNLTINSGASLENDGALDFITAGKNFSLNGTGVYIHNPRNNFPADEKIFSNGNEIFSNTSTLEIRKWNDGSVPLGHPNRIGNSNFGNIILSADVSGGTWDQDGYFSNPSVNRVKGTLTISKGTVVMDDGTGSSIALTLQDVLVNGTGNLVFQRGGNRNLALQTGNFTVSSSAPAKPSVVLDTSFGALTWTVNGNLSLNYDFNLVYGNTYSPGASIKLTVNGNLLFGGGNINLVNAADAGLRMVVNGNTILNNSTGGVCFMDGGNGNLTLITNDLVISAGNANYFLGRPGAGIICKGTDTLIINNDFTVNGTSTTFLAYSDSIFNKVRITVGRDFTMNAANAKLYAAYSAGALTFRTARNFSFLQGEFTGQMNPANTGIDSVLTINDFTFNSGTASNFVRVNRGTGNTFFTTNGNFNLLNSGLGYRQGVIGADSSSSNVTFLTSGNFVQNGGQFSGTLSGSGNCSFTVNGILDVNAGIFKASNNSEYSNAGTVTLNAGSIDYDGGIFSAYYSCNNTSATGSVNVTGNCKINFTSTTDEFTFIGLAQTGFDINNLILSLNIGGTLTIQGLGGSFVSSKALGSETVTLGGLTISAGNNSFNAVQNSMISNGHFVLMNINGNMSVSGGNTFLSASTQGITVTITGDLQISNGKLSLKGGDAGSAVNLNIRGSFTQNGGSFFLHDNPADDLNTAASLMMTVNSNDDAIGDFTQTAGTFSFDNANAAPASLTLALNIKCPNFTIGGSGSISMANAGTGTAFGDLFFAHSGTTNFSRSGNHLIQQTRITVNSGNTLDVLSGDLQIASHTSLPPIQGFCFISSGAILNLRTHHICSNALKTYSSIAVLGRLRIQNVNGLYDGTTNAALSTTLADSLDYNLFSSSTVEYNGTDNQVITGIGTGKAKLAQHKYGNLEINFTGTADTEFVFPSNTPTDSSVSVRTNLVLTNGELNLDNDHTPSNGGGRMIVVENSAVTAISRSNGYIRSETENGTARLKWILNSITGNHIVPFGLNSTMNIPFTFATVSGNAGNIYAATWHTNPGNNPLPTGVTNLKSAVTGQENSANTVDRFWYLNVSGSATSANINFQCTPAENSGITNLIAQRWIAAQNAWTFPGPGTQSISGNGIQVNGISTYNNWWALSGNYPNLLRVKLFIDGLYQVSSHKMIAAIDPVLQDTIADSITVQLAGAAVPHAIIASSNVPISTSGFAYPSFPNSVIGQSYYIVIHQRNSLETWSSSAFNYATPDSNYTFSDAASKAYGNNMALLESGVYGIHSGDLDQNGIIELNDLSLFENSNPLFETGYVLNDLNGDQVVETADFSFLENKIGLGISVLKP